MPLPLIPIALGLGKVALGFAARAGARAAVTGGRAIGRKLSTLAKSRAASLGVGGSLGGGLKTLAGKFMSKGGGQETQQASGKLEDDVRRDGEEAIQTGVEPTPSLLPIQTNAALLEFSNRVSNTTSLAKKQYQNQIKEQDQDIRIIKQIEPSIIAMDGINAAANSLGQYSKQNIRDSKQEILEEKRQQDEEKIEKKDSVFSKIGERVSEYGDAVKTGLMAALAPFASSALLITGAAVADKLGIGQDDPSEEQIQLRDQIIGTLKKLPFTSPIAAVMKYFRKDRISTDEEIAEKYGDDIESSELLMKAGEGMGTDENAILYAFRNIDTPEKYISLKTDFEENALTEINKKRTRPYFTMEQYLRSELSEGEYKKLQNQVTQQMVSNQNNEKTKLNEFFREAGYDELELIPGIENVTPEEYQLYQEGKLIAAVTKDGDKKLYTEKELRETDEVAPGIKRAARQRARNRGKFNEAQEAGEVNIVSPSESNQQTPVLVNNVMVNNQQKTPRTFGTTPPTTGSSAAPPRMTNDSFIDVGYST